MHYSKYDINNEIMISFSSDSVKSENKSVFKSNTESSLKIETNVPRKKKITNDSLTASFPVFFQIYTPTFISELNETDANKLNSPNSKSNSSITTPESKSRSLSKSEEHTFVELSINKITSEYGKVSIAVNTKKNNHNCKINDSMFVPSVIEIDTVTTCETCEECFTNSKTFVGWVNNKKHCGVVVCEECLPQVIKYVEDLEKRLFYKEIYKLYTEKSLVSVERSNGTIDTDFKIGDSIVFCYTCDSIRVHCVKQAHEQLLTKYVSLDKFLKNNLKTSDNL